MKIALIGTVAQSAIGFRKDMILALKEKNHEVNSSSSTIEGAPLV